MNEEKQSKKKWMVALFGSLLLSWMTTALSAETRVAGTTIAVNATVSAVSSLVTAIRNVSDNGNATAVAFGSIGSGQSSWNNLAPQYVRITVENNAISWRLRAYSNNFVSAPSTTTWGYQYGGLKGNVAGAKVPMAWMVLPSTLTTGPATGNPAQSATNGWTFLKDLNDADDPNTTDNNESFAASDLAGFTNIAFGAPSFTRMVRPNVTGGSELLGTPSTPFIWYLEGDFSVAAAATYTTNLVLEMFNQ